MVLERKHFGVLFPAIFYFAAAFYNLFFVVYDLGLAHIYVLAALCVASAVGILLTNRWGLWLGLVLFPIIVASAASTLYYSINIMVGETMIAVLVFNISLVLYMVFSAFSFLLLLDKRREFK